MLIDTEAVIKGIAQEAIRAYVLRNIHIYMLCIAIIERQKASTPDWVIDEMETAIKRIDEARRSIA